MKRSTIALAVCMGLCACSGQRNEDTNRLNSGKRDAAADADREVDADGEDGEDAGQPREDASEPGADAGAGNDAGMQGGDASGGQGDSGADGGTASDSGTGGDTGILADAGSGGGDAGDAGSNPNQLRIKLVFEQGTFFTGSVIFSYADGGVESVRDADSEGLVVSDTAPAMFTTYFPSRADDQHSDIITVVAPALGDYIVIDPPLSRGGADSALRYLANVGTLPPETFGVASYAGVDGCAPGYLDVVPPPLPALEIYQRTDCRLESNGNVIAMAFDEPGTLLGFASATLPPVASTPVSFALDQWLAPETLTLLLTGGMPGADSEGNVFMRKGALKIRADRPDGTSPPYTFPFGVRRSIVDSFDFHGLFINSSGLYENFFGKNRPAASVGETVTMDLGEALPALGTVTTNYLPLKQPSATFTPQGGSTPADAVLAMFSWSWPGTETFASLSWRFIAPPGATSVTVPAPPVPTGGPFGFGIFIPDNADVQLDGVEYYDSDAQNGYRDFLKEPLRPAANRLDDGTRVGDLLRDIPRGGNTRMIRYKHAAR